MSVGQPRAEGHPNTRWGAGILNWLPGNAGRNTRASCILLPLGKGPVRVSCRELAMADLTQIQRQKGELGGRILGVYFLDLAFF